MSIFMEYPVTVKSKMKVSYFDENCHYDAKHIDRMAELSELILDLLKRAYMTVGLTLIDENVTGESDL